MQVATCAAWQAADAPPIGVHAHVLLQLSQEHTGKGGTVRVPHLMQHDHELRVPCHLLTTPHTCTHTLNLTYGNSCMLMHTDACVRPNGSVVA